MNEIKKIIDMIVHFGSFIIMSVFLYKASNIPSTIDKSDVLFQFIMKKNAKQSAIRSKYCFSLSPQQSYSTKRDVTITSVFYHQRNLALNLLSIRQSGCEATIVVLADNSVHFQGNLNYIINELDVIVVRSSIAIHNRYSTDMTRTYFVVNYLKQNREKYDRVFFFDSFDVFFERDPFQYFTEKKVYLFQESLVTINQDYWDRIWIVNCYNEESLKIVGDQFFVCSGTVGSGSIDEFIKLYTILDAEKKWRICKVDQGPLNYLLYSGKLKENNLNYHVFNHTGPVLTLNLAIKFYTEVNGFMFVLNALNMTPAVIHQTKNFPKIQRSLYDRCKKGLNELNGQSNSIKNLIKSDLNAPLNN